MPERAIVHASVPQHVPAELVKPFDFRTGLGSRPQETIAGLHDGIPIFYSPERHTFGDANGAWVVTRAKDVRKVMSHPDIFSSKIQGEFLASIGESIGLPPLDSDPPQHDSYRSVLAPLFSARRMVELEPKIRKRCVDLIDSFEADGKCEFISAFAEKFPTAIFVDLMGLPSDRLEVFVGWAHAFIHGDTVELRIETAKTIIRYFRELFRDPACCPDNSVVHHLIAAKVNDRPLTEDQFTGLSLLLFNAGLDTIVSSLGFIFRLLAEDAELRDKLQKNPGMIPRHAEEMMRLFSPVTPQRIVTQDTQVAGVTMKRGDIIALSLAAASRDPELFDDASQLVASRNPNAHFAFGYGIHRCVGSQLARRNIAIAIEEFLSRIPRFQLAPGAEVTATGGSVLALDRVDLIWRQ